MWMGRQLARRAREEPSDMGVVSAAGEKLCVVVDGEERQLLVYGPGGYRWAPTADQDVLVLKNGAVVGALVQGGLEPGEVELFASGGASIRLAADVKVRIRGDVQIQGDLEVSGEISCAALNVGGVSVP